MENLLRSGGDVGRERDSDFACMNIVEHYKRCYFPTIFLSWKT